MVYLATLQLTLILGASTVILGGLIGAAAGLIYIIYRKAYELLRP